MIGGVFIPGLSNVYHCIKSCTGTCVAVDFDTADNSCWHHVTKAVCTAPLAVRTGSTHYRLPSCLGGFSPTINKIPSKDWDLSYLFIGKSHVFCAIKKDNMTIGSLPTIL